MYGTSPSNADLGNNKRVRTYYSSKYPRAAHIRARKLSIRSHWSMVLRLGIQYQKPRAQLWYSHMFPSSCPYRPNNGKLSSVNVLTRTRDIWLCPLHLRHPPCTHNYDGFRPTNNQRQPPVPCTLRTFEPQICLFSEYEKEERVAPQALVARNLRRSCLM